MRVCGCIYIPDDFSPWRGWEKSKRQKETKDESPEKYFAVTTFFSSKNAFWILTYTANIYVIFIAQHHSLSHFVFVWSTESDANWCCIGKRNRWIIDDRFWNISQNDVPNGFWRHHIAIYSFQTITYESFYRRQISALVRYEKCTKKILQIGIKTQRKTLHNDKISSYQAGHIIIYFVWYITCIIILLLPTKFYLSRKNQSKLLNWIGVEVNESKSSFDKFDFLHCLVEKTNFDSFRQTFLMNITDLFR